MDYFTFLGIGNGPEGYVETIYLLDNTQMLLKFVQEAIYKNHQNEINRMIAFCTKESKARCAS